MGNICRNGDSKNQHIADGMDDIADDIAGHELDDCVERTRMTTR